MVSRGSSGGRKHAEASLLASMEKHCQSILASIESEPTCAWCKHPHKRLYRRGLCGHCHRLQRKLAERERVTASWEARGEDEPAWNREVQWRLNVARNMVDLAKAEGEAYGDIHQRKVDGITLEYLFRHLGMSFLGKRFFLREYPSYGGSALFDLCFSPNQMRVMFYLVSVLMREFRRKKRRREAYHSPSEPLPAD